MSLAGCVVYIAGPVTGIEDSNRAVFHEAEMWLEQFHGAIPLNPTWLPDGLGDHQSYMNICLPMLGEADAILMLPDWYNSVGAKMEYDRARALGLPIYEYTPSKEPSLKLVGLGKNYV